jgi:hypothetical protein
MVLGLEDAVTVLNKWKDDSAQILVVSESPFQQSRRGILEQGIDWAIGLQGKVSKVFRARLGPQCHAGFGHRFGMGVASREYFHRGTHWHRQESLSLRLGAKGLPRWLLGPVYACTRSVPRSHFGSRGRQSA